MKKLLILAFVILAIVWVIDREKSRITYENGDRVTECIFEMNCDHFNAQLIDQF